MANESGSMIDPTIAKALLQGDLRNLALKVKDNKPLSKGEREILMASLDGHGGESNGETWAKNQTELAKILGVERKTIQRWLKAHPELKEDPYRQSNGKYSVPHWREWRRNRSGIKSDDDLSKSQLEARRILLQNEKLEVQIGVMRGEYAKISDVEQWASEMVMAAAKILDSIPPTFAPQVVGLTVPDAEIRLQEAIDEAKEQLHAQPWK